MSAKLKIFGSILLIILVGTPIAWLAVDLRAYFKGKQSENWSETPGEILSSSVSSVSEKGHSRYTPKVSYRYVVEGKTYESTLISYRVVGSSREDALDVAMRFLVGEEVTVYFDPDRPKSAVLIPGAGSLWRPGTVISAALIILFSGLFIYTFSGKNQR